jgi:phage-related protein
VPALPAYVQAHAGDAVLMNCFLVEIEFSSGTVRWTTWDVDVFALGHKWDPKPMRVTGLSSRQGELGVAAEVEVGDAGGLASAYVLAGTSPGGTAARVYEAWLPTSGADTNAAAVLKRVEGRVGKAQSVRNGDTMTGRFSLAAAVELRFKKVPRRDLTPKCPFTFKDAACSSDGSDTSCDKTFTACSQPTKKAGNPIGGNRARFGGIRNAPPDGYVITWADGSFTVRVAPDKKAG